MGEQQEDPSTAQPAAKLLSAAAGDIDEHAVQLRTHSQVLPVSGGLQDGIVTCGGLQDGIVTCGGLQDGIVTCGGLQDGIVT